jgi:hypothetical protein
MTESDCQVLRRYWDPELETTVQVEGTVVKQQMHTYVQAIFFVAKGEPITRFRAVETEDKADAVRGLFDRLRPPSASGGTPPRTSSG